eukprot:CAMPEP_0168491498 /NCGR_PEP_ID=MMETSP0228-20121227/69728_1 /TAXON_ID=133427 /ORGANISM="Protoceratium reticulatum, Strain CCCM 535 (=CCMP 1889)" /LENGTH=106 /DNA_ID=CAMNT_0008508239 /DNA_START=62 /DNA_END=382 /DNA_ORIENTATION=-
MTCREMSATLLLSSGRGQKVSSMMRRTLGSALLNTSKALSSMGKRVRKSCSSRHEPDALLGLSARAGAAPSPVPGPASAAAFLGILRRKALTFSSSRRARALRSHE